MDLLHLATSTPAPAASGGGFDLLGTILWPLKWLVELVLVAWHAIFTFIGLPAAAGITWVLAIIGLVVVVRAAMIPLFVRQIKSQRKMMEIAPELRKVQEKYKGKKDQLSREAMSRETMALYKKHGTTPVSSCLPLLVQMPVFFSLYSVLSSIKLHAENGQGGVGPLTPELTLEFYNAKLFGVASLHETLIDAINANNTTAIIITVTLVVLMIASQFFTQLQIISKNLSPEAKTGQAYQMQRIMLWILPLGFVFSGVAFPLGVVIYWFTSNIWTGVQQFIVIREMPTPGSEAAKAREERLARKGKALDASGKVVSMEKYEAEQQRLLEEAERARAATPKRQQPVSKQRAKKQAQKGPGTGGGSGSSPSSSGSSGSSGSAGKPGPTPSGDAPGAKPGAANT
ncbi:membrane protein insertase YidC [Microbacterium sp. B2969]|uniref:Membrane protein insertase YidC n=1 Tax=Microbacterium alkaliflavum TaxID=3248839 RepID=A0ABW7QA90_9MICO